MLSLWFASQPAPRLLPRLAQAVEALPPEVQTAGVHGIAVHPLAWSEPPLLEEHFSAGMPLADALARMRDFLNDD